MGYSWDIHGVFMGYTYVSVMYRLCVGYVSVMCRYILGALGKGDNRKKEGRQQEKDDNIVPRQERNNMHYQNCRLLEYINQNYLERCITRTYWNGEWSE